jgi:alkylation response protein AidB-like acyl-CoA dehydrogenase
MATLYARGAADFMAKSALQLHGAIGYTFEFDLQLWLKRSWALQRCFGSAAWHRERVAKLALSAHDTAPQLEAQPRAELPH